ncbi:hypothetical protein V3589_02570 [Sinorhizobium fredii]|uniref:hypothetical protein n=1 Tax=Rhizobium fredii TaxID=380 RepID=UPI0030960927
MTILLFDMDGVLTAARQPMTAEMADLIFAATARHSCYIVTGSDYAKVREQIPQKVIDYMTGIFACGGNEFWSGDQHLSSNDHDFPAEMITAIDALLLASPCPIRTGRYIERRAGMLNVSVAGRNASPDQRRAYSDFDRATGEREAIAETIICRFPGYDATLGGEISVDIVPKGCGKEQVAALLPSNSGPVYFFGDRLEPGGNDWQLAVALRKASPANRNFRVNSPKDTKVLLEAILNCGVAA